MNTGIGIIALVVGIIVAIFFIRFLIVVPTALEDIAEKLGKRSDKNDY